MNQKSNTVQYDDFADTFGRSRLDLHWPEIDEVLSQCMTDVVARGGSIADIGCGNGRLLRHIIDHPQNHNLRDTFATYVGMDNSSELIDQAKSEPLFSNVFPSTHWHIGDMRDMAEHLQSYGAFELIFFIASFQHLATREERLSVLSQAKKLLTKTGKIIMINWNLTDPSQVKYESSRTSEYPDGSADFDIKIGSHQRYYHAFSHEEYESLARDAGLELTDTFGERNSIVFLH